MDTAAPGEGGNRSSRAHHPTDGTTVLGGDDKTGCAIIIETIHQLRERQIPHGPVEAVFTVRGNRSLGAKHLT
jgi:tripeptide aminopeptidase